MAAHRSWSIVSFVVLLLLLFAAVPASAAPIANDAFQRTWARTDQPTSTDRVSRTWMWGPAPFTDGMTETYAESPGGTRMVQYFDKSRMEITDPGGDQSNPWYVTNGLLVVEMVTGRMQIGDAQFEPRPPAMINVAGDLDDTSGLTYATIAALRDEPAAANGSLIVKRADRAAIVSDDPSLADYEIRTAQRVMVPGIDHQVAEPFWEFMNSSGLVYEDGVYRTDRLFEDPYYATGYPIAEAYWATINVDGRERDVLTQCFERRCLTYTPDNPTGWQVEAGNVGQHYYQWRYQPQPGTQYDQVMTVDLPIQWGTEFYLPRNVLVTRAGDVYVSDSGNNRIQQYDSRGIFVRQWGFQGSAYGQFSSPGGLAEDSDGNIVVADTGNGRVQRFDPTGVFQKAWTTTGLFAPNDVAIDEDDNIFVIDRSGERVWKFDADGVALDAWGGHGSATGMFIDPRGLGLDPAGNVYVADTGNRRVQVFDGDGTFLRLVNSDPQAQLNIPADVAVGATGSAFIVDAGTGTVDVFGSNGMRQASWYTGTSTPEGITIDEDGDVWLASSGDYRVTEYSADGVPRNAWWMGSRGGLYSPTAMAMTPNGYIVVVDNSATIQIFDADGQFISASGGPSVYWGLIDVEVDPYGDVWVVDAGQQRVIRLHPDDGDYTRLTETLRLGADGALGAPVSIAFDTDDNVYIADQGNARILKLTRDGQIITMWGSYGDADGQFQSIQQIAMHGKSVYVLEYGWSGVLRLHQFDRDGRFIRRWRNVESLAMYYQSSMAVDVNGFVYLADRDHYRLVKFTPSGSFVTSFGEGIVGYSTMLAIDPAGNVYTGEEAVLRKFEPVD